MSSTPSASTSRPPLTARVLARALSIPSPTTGLEVHRGVRVPMRDGVDLIADHYEPLTPSPAGTILVRAPYGRGFPFAAFFGSVYATRGYHVVFQSVRGTYGSGGVFSPMVDEVADGADTVEWLRHQPWFTGTFATMGLSYLGFTQWALLMDPPPELSAAIITVGPHDFSRATWGTGAFTVNDFLGWSDMVSRQEEVGQVRQIVRQARANAVVKRTATQAPIGESGRTLLGSGGAWWESWITDPDSDPEFWNRVSLGDALDRVNVPVLLIGGWQDLFLEQTLAQYAHLRDRGVPTALTVGSWTHAQVMTKGAPIVLRESLNWLDEHLAGRPATPRARVHAHVHRSGWIDLPDWPPATTAQTLYLTPAHGLSGTAPDDGAAPSTFTFDPSDPTPTIGGRLLSPQGGYRDDGALALRSDVAEFTGAELTDDLYVLGTPVVELAHSCDNPHNDVFVRVSEVDAAGRSHNVTDGFRRLVGDSASSGTVRLELDDVAHRFTAGSRIRLLVAGGSHPRFVRNLGTDEPVATGTRMATATHTVHHGAGGLSTLVLPVGSPSAD
ncbi:CocE/NonD family hydrolase [Mycolicibacterium sediminis]|uniref:Hydrolase n=1 Tax=Mycolicibacterium sediminis TaxID=1286180 RepID=A0A7I7QSY5_9MYCO|nr:CocE/NonD family hydrolase [Mycolicibacterium sediminis]BBY29401.1 hydrolase [Mycolicibacterium sediminis]